MNQYVLTGVGVIMLVLIFSSYSKRQEIKRIDAKYYTGVFKSFVDISYQELENEKPGINDTPMNVKDTVITNPEMLLQIQQELSKIEVSPEKDEPDSEDIRIMCTIEYEDGRIDKIGIEGKFTDYLTLNGHYCKNCFRLMYLIKKSIGYYSRMHENMFPLFYELQDSSFKDTIINDRGQKYWRGKPNRFSPDGKPI